MSNLEHLIENTLVAMEDDKLCFNDIRKRVQNDINLRCTSLSADDVLEICQYVKYVWCRDLENRLNAQYKEARKLLTPTKYIIRPTRTTMMDELRDFCKNFDKDCSECPFYDEDSWDDCSFMKNPYKWSSEEEIFSKLLDYKTKHPY